MRFLRSSSILAFLLLVVLVVHAPMGAAMGLVDVRINGSFEEDADLDGMPDGWSTAAGAWSSGDACVIERVGEAYDGAFAMRLHAVESANCFVVSDPVPALSGQYFEAHAKAHNAGASGTALLSVVFFDADGNALLPVTSVGSNQVSEDWADLEFYAFATAGAVEARVVVDGSLFAGETVWVDAVTLTIVGV